MGTALFQKDCTQQECNKLCAEYTAISKAWNALMAYKEGYPIQLKIHTDWGLG